MTFDITYEIMPFLLAIACLLFLVNSLRRVAKSGISDTAKAVWVLIILLTFPIGALLSCVMIEDPTTESETSD